MSEVVWSNKDNRDWESFRHRMIGEFDRFSNSDIQACRTYFDVQFHSFINKNKQLEITLECDRPEVEIRYNTEGHTPTMQDSLYTKPFILQTSETVTAAAFVNGKMIGKSTSDSYIVSKLTGLGYSKSVASSWYDGGGNNALTDGKPGNAKVTSQWVGLGKGIDCEIIFDCNEGKNPITIHKFALGMLHAVALGVDAATNIKLFGSQDGTAYKLIGETTVKPVKTTYWSVIRPQMEFQPVEVRYIKVVIGKTPDSPLDSPTKGGGSHLFVDEISVW